MKLNRCELRFVVLGDTHFCRREARGCFKRNCLPAELPDHVRYSDMVNEILVPMFRKIREMKPDFVISTGDFVEGGMSSSKKTYEEIRQGWEQMQKLGVPCLMAKGTHEGSGRHPGAEAYRKIIFPGMSGQTGRKINNEYFCYKSKGSIFFILDYLGYDDEQESWLESRLNEMAGTAKHIFIVAHPPLYNWGRHFFNEPDFIKRIIALCKKYPVDAYFCGHTHNQVVSFHETDGRKGYLQIAGSSVGYSHMDLVPLDEFHVRAEFSPRDKYLWGIHEDSSPGFYLVECKNENMHVKWFSFKGDTASLSVKKRRTLPLNIKTPKYRKTAGAMNASDFNQVKSAWIYVYGIYRDDKSTTVSFNGHDCGHLPGNSSYAARRYLLLDGKAIGSIKSKNEVKIKLPASGEFILGSVSLELVLLDNRIIHSPVCSGLFACGERWKLFPKPRRYRNVRNGQTITLTIKLNFGASKGLS